MATSTYPLTLIYDGACPVCRLEMTELAQRNTEGKLVFVDMSQPDFDLEPFTRVQHTTLAALDAQLHGMRPDGTFVIGMEPIRLAYEAVGLGALWKPTRLPIISSLADWGYSLFAKHRLRISRILAPLVLRIEARRTARRMQNCQSGVCSIEERRP